MVATAAYSGDGRRSGGACCSGGRSHGGSSAAAAQEKKNEQFQNAENKKHHEKPRTIDENHLNSISENLRTLLIGSEETEYTNAILKL